MGTRICTNFSIPLSGRYDFIADTGVLEEVLIESVGCQQKLILSSLSSKGNMILHRFF